MKNESENCYIHQRVYLGRPEDLNKMRKQVLSFFLLLGILFAAACATAEISTNLRKKTTYTTGNKIKTQSFVDRNGDIVMADDLGYATLVNSYTTGTKLARTEYFDAAGRPVNNSYGFSVKIIRYTMSKICEEIFLDADGNPAPGPDGYSRSESDWHVGKRHLETRYYDTQGNLFRSSKQPARKVTEYPKNGSGKWVKPLSETYYDAAGNMMRGPEGYARVEYEYYKATSLVIKKTYLDANGSMIRGPEGYAQVEYEYISGTKQPVRTTYRDAERNLYFYRKDGFAILEKSFKDGKAIREAYYGADGKLCSGPKGYAVVEREYRKSSKPTREAYFDVNMQPYKMPDGYYIVSRKYSLKGKVSEEAYFDAEGKPCLCKDGFHMKRTTYRSRDGKVTQEYYFGLDGKRMIHPTLGYAICINDYDGNRLSRTTYYDTNKEVMDCAGGYAKIIYGFDKQKSPTGIRYEHADGSPAIGPDGYAKAEYITDQDKRIVTEMFYDTENHPIVNNEGIYEAHYTWDGELKTSAAFFKKGEPALNNNGVHLLKTEYNGDGKETKISCFGLEGEPVSNAEGYSVKETEYLSNGKVAAERYYNEEGKLILTPGKTYAYQRTEYDEDGISYTVVQFNTQNQPISVDGYITRFCELDENGRVIRTTYLDENNNPVTDLSGIGAVENIYNEEGQIICVTYKDLKGELTCCKDGYAIVRQRYDQYGNKAEERYFGTDGLPVLGIGGYAAVQRIYQMKDRMLEATYYGTDDKKITIKSGYAHEKRTLDEFGNTSIVVYYGPDGERAQNADGYSEIRRVFNSEKKVIHQEWYDKNGIPMTIKGDQYCQMDLEYDAAGNLCGETYYDENRNPVSCNNGYDEVRNEYNGKKQIVRIVYYLSGVQTTDVNGCAEIRREYNTEGFMIWEAYFGMNGEPVMHAVRKYHAVERSYLDKNHILSETWFDADGNPTSANNTYCRVEYEYDEAGNKAVERYYGADGQPTAHSGGYDEIHQRFNEENRVERIEYLSQQNGTTGWITSRSETNRDTRVSTVHGRMRSMHRVKPGSMKPGIR